MSSLAKPAPDVDFTTISYFFLSTLAVFLQHLFREIVYIILFHSL